MIVSTIKVEENKPSEREEEARGLLGHLQRSKHLVRPHLLKYVSLFVLVLQNACHVLVTRYALTRDKNLHPPFSKWLAVFFNELIKLCSSLTLFLISTNDLRRAFEILHHHFISYWWDTLKVGVPSLIYLIQNFLILLALENLDSGTYMVTYQLKILTTALFSVLILKRRLSIAQWVSLLILVVGVAIVQYYTTQRRVTLSVSDPPFLSTNATTISALVNESDESVDGFLPTTVPSRAHEKMQNPILGLLYVLIACFLSGFAGIYFEKILKGSKVSLWLRNVQLSLLSLPFVIGIIIWEMQGPANLLQKGLLTGFDWVVWSAVLLQAVGGLVVAVVIKYADNILKAFATSVAIVVATIASFLLLNTELNLMFISGAALVISSVVVYSIFPYRRGNGIVRNENGEEMQVIMSRVKIQQPQEGEEEPANDGETLRRNSTGTEPFRNE